MTNGGRAKRLFGVAMLALGVALLTGCPEDDPVDAVLAPVTEGDRVIVIANFIVSSGDGFGIPGASYSTPGLTDAFVRATGEYGFYNTNNPWNYPTYNFQEFIRSAADDPRLPTLDAATSGAGPGTQLYGVEFCVLGDGNWTGPSYWDLFCEIDGLKPSTRYTIVMAQLYLEINGELDALQVLRGQAVSEPDELKLLPSGTAQGYPDVLCDFSTATPVPTDANPFVLGYVDTDGTGDAIIDCLPQALPDEASWYGGEPEEPVSGHLPVMPNQPFTTPQPTYTYNYWYMVEGQGTAQDPVPSGPIAVRVQIGPDLRSDGLPHFNAYAPFPDAASAAPPQPELSLEAGPLATLSGSDVYQLWLYNSSDQTAAPLTARDVIRIDTEAGTEETIATNAPAAVQGGSLTDAFRFVVFMADNPGEILDYDHMLITLESSTSATEPSDATVLFKNFADVSDPALPVVEGVGSLTFGSFDAATATPYRTWGLAGDGLAHFFGDQFRARVEQLARPPIGFFYRGWLAGTDGDGATVYHDLGPVTVDDPPTYTPLFDADIRRDIPSEATSVVTETFVAQAISRELVADIPSLAGLGGDAHPFCTVQGYWVTLEPKARAGATTPGTTVAIIGATPETFLRSDVCR